MSCINDCKNDCCKMPAYRNDVSCDRCGNIVLTVFYCLTCKHMMEMEGPDYTDPHRIAITFSWPNPPFKIPFRAMRICGACKLEISDICSHGVSFKTGFRQGKREPGVLGEHSGFLRFRIVEEPAKP